MAKEMLGPAIGTQFRSGPSAHLRYFFYLLFLGVAAFVHVRVEDVCVDLQHVLVWLAAGSGLGVLLVGRLGYSGCPGV